MLKLFLKRIPEGGGFYIILLLSFESVLNREEEE
jgi:hypothetical protein